MPRLSYALLAALALHGMLLLVRMRRPALSSQRAPRATEQLLEIDLAFEPSPASEALPVAPGSSPAAGANTLPAALAGRVASRLPRSNSEAALVESDTTSTGAAPEPAGAPGPGVDRATEATNDVPARKIDLGLDGHFFLRPENQVLPRAHKSEFQRHLEASLSGADVQRGLARGGALVGSLHSAVSAAGPTRGEALVRVTVGADGAVSGVELMQGSEGDWSAVLRSFRELASRKRVRVPPGAGGLRVTFSVKAKVQRPSGKDAGDAELGVDRPSLKPNGLTFHGDFDVADLAGGTQRLVYARVISEEVL